MILKQDKGRGVVILNRSKYIEKCLSIVRKVQRTLRKIKDKIPSLLYSKICLTGSSPGRCYVAAKLHKAKGKGTVEDLPLRSIISNIRKATYGIAKN